MSDHDDDLAPRRERIREHAAEPPAELNVLDGEDGRFVERPTQSAETVHLYDKAAGGDEPPVDPSALDLEEDGRFVERPTQSAETVHLYDKVAGGDEPPVDGLSFTDSVRTVHDGADSDGFFEKPTWEVAADDEPGLLDDGGL